MRREAEIGQPTPEAAEEEAGAPRLPSASMAGKRGLIMGVANNRSIAWGLAQALRGRGAELAFTYQGEAFGSRVRPLAESVGSELVLPCDVASEGEVAAVFDQLGQSWDGLDFVVHALAFSDKEELKGRYLDTSRGNFARTLEISCYSFTEIARRAAPLMGAGGSLLTLTYLGAERVTPNYNVMGVAKAALEASVRYLAVDLGDRGIRVNAISAGPMRTLAGAAIADARFVYRWSRDHAPMARNVLLEEVGNAGLYLLSDLARGVTGEIHHVDAGYNTIGIPSPKRMSRDE
jgi:enoyl-[acyl-carrier protein] reductase I